VVTREGVDKLELSERFKIMGEQMHRQVRFSPTGELGYKGVRGAEG
jgi:hypothetical protein